MSIKTDKIKVGKFEWFYRHTEIKSDETPKTHQDSDMATPRPTALFLHGLPSHSYTWQKTITLLEDEQIPCIAPDWIGCGFSEKPSLKDFDYTPETFINGLGELIATLKLDKFYLVVQGFLGSVGIQYALRNPEQIEGLIILNTPIAPNTKLPWAMKQMTFPVMGDMMTQDVRLV